MRIVEYKTKLTADKKAVLEKEVCVYRPDIERKMSGPDKVCKLAKGYLHMDELAEEYLYMICMNVKLEMTSLFEISHGTVNSSVVGVREVFQKALLANAVNIIMIHNHPSGDCTPSREDINITKRLVDAGELLGVSVLDHIIVVGDGYCSLKEKGFI